MADKISWIDAYGNEYPLNIENNFRVTPGMQGRFMPPVALTEEEVPFMHGSRLRNTRFKPRDVDIPLFFKSDSEAGLRKKIRDSLGMLNPLKGDGRLRVTAADGSQRELYCRYSAGFEGKEDRSVKGIVWMNVILAFHAFDPFWYDTGTIVQTFKINQNPGFFFPILPLRLASSTVFADVSVQNSGDVETWPEWIIQGPGDSIVLNNITTGEIITLDISLATGEALNIRTSPIPPNEKSITKSDGTNVFFTLSDDSSLWALQVGNNSIQIQMANTTADSCIQLSYRNRYLGA
jgi:phage-related protein